MRSSALLFAVVCAVGCAHAPPAPSAASMPVASPAPGGQASATETRRVVEDPALGYSLELPNDRAYRPGPDGDSIAAVGEDGTVVRVFPLFFAAKTPSARDCWARLAGHDYLPPSVEKRPKDADELARLGPKGLPVQSGGKLYLNVYPRAESCLVLAVDSVPYAHATEESVGSAAQMAMASFKAGEPAPQMRPQLAYEAGFQLLDIDDFVGALAQFEEALKLDPTLQKAHLGAGLAAYSAGKGYEQQAIDHLEKAVSTRADSDSPEGHAFEDKLYREALTDLALAYASLQRYGPAKQKLLEAADRYPDDAVVLYNLACVLALGGETDEALYQLKSAFTHNPGLAEHAKEDDDLKSLRGKAEFQKLLAEAAAAPPVKPAGEADRDGDD